MLRRAAGQLVRPCACLQAHRAGRVPPPVPPPRRRSPARGSRRRRRGRARRPPVARRRPRRSCSTAAVRAATSSARADELVSTAASPSEAAATASGELDEPALDLRIDGSRGRELLELLDDSVDVPRERCGVAGTVFEAAQRGRDVRREVVDPLLDRVESSVELLGLGRECLLRRLGRLSRACTCEESVAIEPWSSVTAVPTREYASSILASRAGIRLARREAGRRRVHGRLQRLEPRVETAVSLQAAELGGGPLDLGERSSSRWRRRCELTFAAGEPRRGRRDGLAEGVDALGEVVDLRPEPVDACVARARQGARSERRGRRLAASRAPRRSTLLVAVARERLDALRVLVELLAQRGDLAVLARERGGGRRDGGGEGGEPVGEDVDAVRQALLELRVVLRERLDRAPQLLRPSSRRPSRARPRGRGCRGR